MNIAIMGFGVVGQCVADLSAKRKELLVTKILDLRKFPDSFFAKLITDKFDDIVNDASIETVVECMGGVHPAYDFSKACLEAGKNVVTSNKAVVAAYGPELLKLATEKGVHYHFEASVGGGIPLLNPLMNDLAWDNIRTLRGVLNGTTNFMLERMKNGVSYDEALKEAQAKGYAEKDPTADVDGWDTARKICILVACLTGNLPDYENIYVKGIRDITAEQMALANKCGGTIRLVANYTDKQGSVRLSVAPAFVENKDMLAHVSGVLNAVVTDSESRGKTMLEGEGAGGKTTASAILSDLRVLQTGLSPANPGWNRDSAEYKNPAYCHWLVLPGCKKCAEKAVKAFYPDGNPLREPIVMDGCFDIITPAMTEEKIGEVLKALDKEPLCNLFVC